MARHPATIVKCRCWCSLPALCLWLLWAFCELGVAGGQQGTTRVVEPGQGTLSAALASAEAHDTLQLRAGTYAEAGSLAVGLPLDIVGAADGQTTLLVAAGGLSVDYHAATARWPVCLHRLWLQQPGSPPCELPTPRPLSANISLDITHASIQQGRVHIEADLGPWYSSRQLEGLGLGRCTFGADYGDSTVAGGRLTLDFATCRANTGFSVVFARLRRCGLQPTRTATSAVYAENVGLNASETITNRSVGGLALAPVARTMSTYAPLRIQLDRVQKISATLAVTKTVINFKTQAVIREVRLYGDNRTRVDMLLLLPAPFAIPANTTGAIEVVSNAQGADTSNYTFYGAECNMMNSGQVCAAPVSFIVSACDATGSYRLLSVPFTCQQQYATGQIVAPEDCPLPMPQTLEVVLSVETVDVCKVARDTSSLLVEINLTILNDGNFSLPRPNTTYTMDEFNIDNTTNVTTQTTSVPGGGYTNYITQAELDPTVQVFGSIVVKPFDDTIALSSVRLKNVVREGLLHDSYCKRQVLPESYVRQVSVSVSKYSFVINTTVLLTPELACVIVADRSALGTATLYSGYGPEGFYSQVPAGMQLARLRPSLDGQASTMVVCDASVALYPLPDLQGSPLLLDSPTVCTEFLFVGNMSVWDNQVRSMQVWKNNTLPMSVNQIWEAHLQGGVLTSNIVLNFTLELDYVDATLPSARRRRRRRQANQLLEALGSPAQGQGGANTDLTINYRKKRPQAQTDSTASTVDDDGTTRVHTALIIAAVLLAWGAAACTGTMITAWHRLRTLKRRLHTHRATLGDHLTAMGLGSSMVLGKAPMGSSSAQRLLPGGSHSADWLGGSRDTLRSHAADQIAAQISSGSQSVLDRRPSYRGRTHPPSSGPLAAKTTGEHTPTTPRSRASSNPGSPPSTHRFLFDLAALQTSLAQHQPPQPQQTARPGNSQSHAPHHSELVSPLAVGQASMRPHSNSHTGRRPTAPGSNLTTQGSGQWQRRGSLRGCPEMGVGKGST